MPRKTATLALQSPPATPSSSIITVPHLFSPRSYQRRPMAYLDAGGKRAYIVWHRRAGKDLTMLNQVIKKMVVEEFCATYLYIFPKLTQGRRDLWDAKSSPLSGGIPFRAHFPPPLVMETSETEMQITLKPMPHQKPQPISTGRGRTKMVGSIFQVMGTDKESIENLRGINAYGNVFSEFSDQNPEGWYSIIEPVLLENGGWAAFDLTPKGKNHAWTQYKTARSDPAWFCELLTVDETRRDAPGENGERVVTQAQIDALRAEGVAEEVIQQEYYCSFEGYLHGTIYGNVLQQARKDGRIGRVPWVSALPVGTMWDIGRTEQTAIWFYQCMGSEIRFIDFYANVQQGADHYAKVCRERPYLYGRMTLPYDAKVSPYTPAETAEEFLRGSVCRNVVIAPKMTIEAGIDMVRRMFSRFYFDEEKCGSSPNPGVSSGLDALGNYHKSWSDLLQDYSGPPVQDKHGHAADALRTGMVGWEEGLHFHDAPVKEVKVETEFSLDGPRQLMTIGGR